MLADAIDKRLVHVAHGSMRIAIHLRPGGAGDDITFWALLVPWELGYVPLQRSASRRLAAVGVATTPGVARLDRRPTRRRRGGTLFDRLAGRFTTSAKCRRFTPFDSVCASTLAERVIAPRSRNRGERRQTHGRDAIAKSPGVVGSISFVRKKCESSMPEPTPVVDEPSARYTTGSTCS